ncbi:M23 family metallopeptidase [Novosphingobium sp. 1949]|uniref:M23 family metallopeptidase n=1 Tax=Novosphingobium organovorum TaxID=2930092 RepID=A0ABT0BGT0_9SPHN|nr:M23 family metallopeptidase [Novosphingobium organovorum]MCJ2184256.1 M23 family metallopeptidase [Novosphingobium organovorum]
MFKAHDKAGEAGEGGEGSNRVPSLSHAQMVREPASGASAYPSGHTSPGARNGLRTAIEGWCARVDLAPDLACDIGSRKWFRGLATLIGLGAVAFSFWPSFSAVEAATAVPLAPRVRDEFRSQTIAPLALGADSGRRMGASPLVHPLASAPERPQIELVSTLGQGDSFARMLARAGVGDGDIAAVQQLIGATIQPGDIASGTQFDITLGKRPAPQEARALESLDFRARFDLDLTVERSAKAPTGPLRLVPHPIRVDATPLRVRGTVGSSLYRSARAAGAPVAAIQAYLRAIDKQSGIDRALQADDTFDMIVAYKRSAKGDRQVGDLLYAGVEHDGKPSLQLLRWGKDGQMLSARGVSEARSVPIGMPVAGHITSPYGMRRHPILGYVRMHAGIDFGAPYGSPIHAVAAGRVTFAGRHGGHGNYVRIQHSGGLATGYGHMSRIAVRAGTQVQAGQIIGYVGSTGLSTGPHLHLEAYRDGHTINPAGLKILSQPQLDSHERAAFSAQMAALLRTDPGAALAPLSAPASAPVETTREIDRLVPQEVR